jgi:hypothetical protein
VGGPTDDELRRLSASAIQPFLSRLRQLIRRGGRYEDLQHLGSTRDPLLAALRRRSVYSNFPKLRDAVFENLLDVRYPDWRRLESVSVNELPAKVYSDICDDLAQRRIEPGLLDFSAGCFLSEAGFRCDQLVCVALSADVDRVGEASAEGLFKKLDALLDSPDSDQVVETAAELRGILESGSGSGAGESDAGLDDSTGGADVAAAFHARLPEMLLTTPVAWERFRIQLEEHFPAHALPRKEDAPHRWRWLCEGCQYVIVFAVTAGLGEASHLVQNRLRRLVALARCFRTDPDAARHTDMQLGGLWWGWDAETPAKCRLLALPTSDPPVFTQRQLWSYIEPDADWRERNETDEFLLAGHPFVKADDLRSLELGGMLEALKWMNGTSASARQCRDALEYFESAMSFGGAVGTIAPDLQEGWCLVGLMTCLESMFCHQQYREDRVQRVLDGLHRSLRACGLDNAEALAHLAVVRSASGARNSLVHTGKVNFDRGAFDALPSVVALALRGEIERRMRSGT